MVAGLEEQTVFTIDNNLAEPACSRSHNHSTRGHRLQTDDRSSFRPTVDEHARRNYYNIASREQRFSLSRSHATQEC